MRTPYRVIFFDNGNAAAFDENGLQMPEFQVPWIRLYADFIAASGGDPLLAKFDDPAHRRGQWFKRLDGSYSWRYNDAEQPR